ncbi:glycosyltransferase family 4 protein [Hahella sp. SMD15-11]|uniref:Glycosyltransferase family 4 protein n=1 Tax=Thermohahella caldifontis TaxID=3142973 RepID=A0AB39UT00_9GAMM
MKNKCLHISANQYPPLPNSHHTANIWQELAKAFDEYHIVGRSTNNRASYTIEGKLHLHLLPSLSKRQFVFMALSFFLPFYIRKIKPTHVVAQCPILGGLMAVLCKNLYKYKVFVELHGEHYFKPRSTSFRSKIFFIFLRRLVMYSFKRADKIRCLSEDMKDVVISVYGKSFEDKLVVVPNRVDLKTFKFRKTDYAIHEKVNIVTVGRFTPLKNHLGLIRDLFSTGIDFRLTIIGSGDLKSAYFQIFEELGNAENLVVYENISHRELSRILPHCDLYIHYSLSEGVPRALLEAMACGLPVITTNVGYLKGVVISGENGFVIEKPYRRGLKCILNKLLSSEDLRRQIGNNARRHIEDNYEWDHVFTRYRNEILGMELL